MDKIQKYTSCVCDNVFKCRASNTSGWMLLVKLADHTAQNKTRIVKAFSPPRESLSSMAVHISDPGSTRYQ